MNLSEIKQLDAEHFLGVFGERCSVCFVRGEGCTLYDQDGKAYTDLFAGIAVNALGYNHPAVTDALIAQAQTGILHTSNLYYVEPQAKLAALLCANTFADRVFFANSGAEANEGAMKLARKYFYAQGSKRYKILSADHSFHGRTLATVAATGHDYYQAPYRPLLPSGLMQVPYNDLDALRAAMDDETAAVLLEPMQGEGGVTPADPEYLRGVRALCDEQGVLLILDEVQTGVCRTGSLYCHEQYGVTPDILTSAKGLGCGFPIGAVLATEKVASAISIGDHGSTFGGNTLACAVSLSAMTHLIEHDYAAVAKEKGAYLMNALRSIASGKILEVRGMGLLIGVQLTQDCPASALMKRLLARGFVAGTAAGNVLRLAPPLVISKDEMGAFVLALTQELG
ncbi:MAG: aspartate aminotransferase family protein [Clostridiales bacterium]|nr:aspartate aminotransferase family protein [Clostridiales bacterium]MDY5515607.1 aspartate aminotransferase family protein [Candidatus Ventricola sp.]